MRYMRGAKPEWRSTTHWYLDLRKLEDDVRRYVEGNNNLSPNAKQMSLAMLKEGLRPRAITRDNKWGGIPAPPFPGAEGKTIYVWFEAVLGYVSAVIEYFNGSDEWRRYWMNQDTRVVFFIGKDNIPFHVILLPALLMATRELRNALVHIIHGVPTVRGNEVLQEPRSGGDLDR